MNTPSLTPVSPGPSNAGNSPQSGDSGVDSGEGRGKKNDALARAGAHTPPALPPDCEVERDYESLAKDVEALRRSPTETIRDIILAHPEIRAFCVGNAVRCLGAMSWTWDKTTNEKKMEPNYALRYKALEWLADRVDGRPAETVINFNATPKSQRAASDPTDMTPMQIEALERRIALAKKKQAAKDATVVV